MIIVGEMINTSRPSVNEIVEKRDDGAIRELAKHQVEAGANYLDVNCGTQVFNEAETMQWLVETIQSAVEVPLCIDSPVGEVLDAGLELAKFGQPLVNSITAETKVFEEVLPVVVKHQPKTIALCMNDAGIPKEAEERFAVASWLIESLTEAGVAEDDIYLDPLIQPISANDQAGAEVLKSLRMITDSYPAVHKICGLSNISYGSPNRKMLNQLFTVLTMGFGMDAYVLNPTDRRMMGNIYATQALLGQDPHCIRYIKAHRKGLYEE